MTRRKQISILDLIGKVNKRNGDSTCGPDVRRGWNALLEDVLMSNNVYAGFGYLRQDEVPKGHLPGVIPDPSGNGKHQFPDESRVVYYLHLHLLKK